MAQAEQSRTWTSTSGHTAAGVATQANLEEVTIRLEDGREVNLQLNQLIEADQKLLAQEFNFSLPEAPALPVSLSDSTPATGFPHPQGERLGPIQATEQSNYYLYLPNSLKQNRPAPLFVWSNPGGGKKNNLSRAENFAEHFGVILLCSQESKNAMDSTLRVEISLEMIDHLKSYAQVNEKMLFFGGFSGGGAISHKIAEATDGAGVFPVGAYNPYSKKICDFAYYATGSKDFNRYTSANGRNKLREEDALQRYFKGGHSDAKALITEDALFFLMSKAYGDKRAVDAADNQDFEANALLWLHELSKEEEARAYSNALIFQQSLRPIPEHKSLLEDMINKLGQKAENVAYHEALLDMDEFARDYLAPKGSGSDGSPLPEKEVREVEKLLKKYPQENSITEGLANLLPKVNEE